MVKFKPAIVRAFFLSHVTCSVNLSESQAMNNSEFDLDAIYQRSFGNEQQLMSAKQAGCFDCLSIFPVVDIKAWVDDKPTRTALCPKCSTDSVLADDGAVPFSLKMLKALKFDTKSPISLIFPFPHPIKSTT
jgi:hypothetical protein